jgi:DNA polymerase I-like protein with 3'-5' exonuclease and polymerase domains
MYNTGYITKEQRQNAKTLGLGVLYGMGALKAARNLGLRHRKLADGGWEVHTEEVWGFDTEGNLEQRPCSVNDAEFCTCSGKSYVQRYYAAIPELEPTIRRVRSKARETGYIRNPLTGMCQRFDERLRNPHKAFNALIQSSAAEVLRRAFTALGRTFTRPEDPKIILTVHDSISFEIRHSKYAIEQVKIIRQIMENTTKIDVPLQVEIKIGRNLGNMGVINV